VNALAEPQRSRRPYVESTHEQNHGIPEGHM
jgi:hypothetical protein